ncbi:MAG: RHS repeat-associated core domain-containing protein [Phaeodactylibacter xiamenensis]|uniref:RHS repeat-associated core domain-containing protein n=1 Tax=Phaeodactylibacter xiamenensis TaxID=1524460 RepID=UPI001EE6F168|nr:RHS repeat-associated core domain-containing protein [Phaeodactylibacter xiamenensis]MCR9053845.1 RHS repeat-associated core domain-containing protein [bacterium]
MAWSTWAAVPSTVTACRRPTAPSPRTNRYNGKELNEDYGIGLHDYGARWYDAAIGRWTSVDMMADDLMQLDKSPYAYAWNNPVKLTDPDGNCPWCIGAVVGAALDYSIQVGVNLAEGKKLGDALTDVDKKSILISAAAGATGAGLLKNASKLADPKTRKAAEMAVDASVNIVAQAANKGEVDLRETGIAMGLGQAVRTPVKKAVQDGAAETTQQLNKKVDAAKNALNKVQNRNRAGLAPEKASANTSAQRQRLQSIQRNRAAHIRSTNTDAAAAGAVSSGAGQRFINSLLPNTGPTYKTYVEKRD